MQSENINGVDGEKMIIENPDLLRAVKPDTEMKEWLVNFVGSKEQPEDGDVNVEMIIKVMATEFPEFLLPVAEENFIRGYQQAMMDMEAAQQKSFSNTQTQMFQDTETVEDLNRPIQRPDESVEDFCKRKNRYYAWEGLPGGDGLPINVSSEE